MPELQTLRRRMQFKTSRIEAVEYFNPTCETQIRQHDHLLVKMRVVWGKMPEAELKEKREREKQRFDAWRAAHPNRKT